MRRNRVLIDSMTASAGLILFTFGNYLTIQANIGLAPWDCFSIGLSNHLPLTYGQSRIAVSLAVLAVDLLLGERIGIGTILDTVLCGVFLDVFSGLQLVRLQGSAWYGLMMMIAGMFIMAAGQLIYMKAGLCCGPRDSLLVGVGKRMEKIPIGAVQILIMASVLLAGWLLGGKVGIGTAVSAFGLGGTMQLVFAAARFEPRNIHQRDLIETAKELTRRN